MDDKTEHNLAYGPFLKLRNKGGAATPASGAAATDVGPFLCATRMRLGKDLQAIAGLLHIRYNYLVAIEDGRFEDLPGQAYAIGFVRAYAEHLGLDGDEIVRRYKEENAGVRRKASLDFPLPAPESGVPSGMLLVVAVVMGMAVYAVWYSIAGADRRAADLIQEIPDRLATLLGPKATPPPIEPPAPEPVTVAEAPVMPVSTEEGTEVPPVIEGDGSEGESVAVVASEPAPAITPAATSVPAPVVEAPNVVEAPKPVVTTPPPPPVQETKVAETKPVEPPPPPKVATPASVVKPEPTVVAKPPEAPPAKPVEAAVVPPKPPEEPRKETQTASLPATPTPEPTKPVEAVKPPAEEKPKPAAADKPAEAKPAAGADTIELRAVSDSWIQVRAGDQLLLTRLLRKGETYRVPDRQGLTLMTGNAGGVEVLVNGTLMPPLGEEGTVARGVPLEAQRLQTMAKAASTKVPTVQATD